MEFTVDGLPVYAATGGRPFDPARQPIVFLHGAAMDHSVWALQTRWFAHHGRSVVALDLPGHGRSGGAPPAKVPAAAAWLWRALDQLKVARASLVGHSLGSLIALEAAGMAPERVEKLALLGAALPMAVNDEFLGLAERNDHKAHELMHDWAHARRSHMGGCRMPGIWLVGLDTRLTERARPGVMHAGLSACSDYPKEQGYEAARRLQAPVLVLVGERDQMTPPKPAFALAAQFANARVTTLPECGHMMMGEQPDETLDALRSFL